MEIKGIDVSAWNGNIDWKTVADYGNGICNPTDHRERKQDRRYL